ncbi:uncharacterized protein LOC126811934 [Patella vulgata]|uniref:uncharacterized protein LOC126811934 n=1 Tax=Patella vulgata TaxID=6465 RepID=UPI0021808605|nr:uncharacterized protein LOC126811934 [Patella vulgata]XP_055954934.1 uncharacterized protein LOC126811934 [Patella vulgata]
MAKAIKEKSRIDELTQKFLKIRENALKKGLDDQEIKETFLSTDPTVENGSDKSVQKKGLKSQYKILNRPLFQIQLIVIVAFTAIGFQLGAKEAVYDMVYGSRCVIDINPVISEMVRPLANCKVCRDLRAVPIERNLSVETFMAKYAFTGVPVLIKDATSNWTAMQTFSYNFFKDLYTNTEGAFDITEEECQFFPYKTEFQSLEEALNMTDARVAFEEGERPWYFGWSNCHEGIAKILRSHYERPYFIPKDSESSTIDWMFMGGSGLGAFMHLDYVERPSWQAQISGKKTWDLVPSPECENICHSMNVTVEKGDIFVVDTNMWYHATFVHPGEISITIGSEYD